MNINFIKKLPIPKDVKAMFPVRQALAEIKAERDAKIKAVFSGESDLFLLIIGPCSADRKDAVMEYMTRLAKVQEKVKDKILIIPRCYTGKPRSSGQGYMGLLHRPDPEGAENIYDGLISVRKLMIKILAQTEFTCADEMLYPENHRYLSDLLSYVAVGARSTEDQQHRLTASGLDIPVGFKNPTSGDLRVMIQSIAAAKVSHHFIYRGWEAESTGNPLAHAVLRGYQDLNGKMHANYHHDDLIQLLMLFDEFDLMRPALIIDANHANSGKDPDKQISIAQEIMKERRDHSEMRQVIKGLMIESYLEDGCQPINGTQFGCSITDPCLGWEKSERLIYTVAEQL